LKGSAAMLPGPFAATREYTAKADAIKAREAESKSPLTAIVAQGA